MEKLRKPFQGVLNIIYFNWPFYIFSLTLIVLLFIISFFNFLNLQIVAFALLFIVCYQIIISLIISTIIYDFSNLYSLDWINHLNKKKHYNIANINAGFDETSTLIQQKIKHTNLVVLDFYDAKKHTEKSIERARKKYKPHPNTQKINTQKLEFKNDSFDLIFLILSAHEIRNKAEQILFFTELNRVLKPRGSIIMAEHLRDFPNFLAYSIGFLHFHSKKSWLTTFKKSNLMIKNQQNITPFITTFTLQKNGTTS